jgi:hypothetical protein
MLVALIAWGAGLLVTAYAGSLAISFLMKPIKAPQLDPNRAATLRAMNYSMWLSFNGLTQRALYFHYEGHVHLAECLGLPSSTYQFSVPVDEREQVEHYTYRPLPDDLREWFSTSDDCSTTVTENSDQTIEVRRVCRREEPMAIVMRVNPGYYRSFDIDLPGFRKQTPWLVPGQDSWLTITAPRGCIAHTFPAAESIKFDKTTETFKLPVGFPRNSFSLLDASQIVQKPWLVRVDLLKPAFQGVVIGSLLRALNGQIGMAIFFLVTALAFRTLILNLYGILRSPLSSLITKCGPPVNAAWGVVRQWYFRQNRVLRWILIFVVLFIGVLFALPDLIELVFLLPFLILELPQLILTLAKLVIELPTLIFFIDPSYAIAEILFLVAVCFIEIVAFILRQSLPARKE